MAAFVMSTTSMKFYPARWSIYLLPHLSAASRIDNLLLVPPQIELTSMMVVVKLILISDLTRHLMTISAREQIGSSNIHNKRFYYHDEWGRLVDASTPSPLSFTAEDRARQKIEEESWQRGVELMAGFFGRRRGVSGMGWLGQSCKLWVYEGAC